MCNLLSKLNLPRFFYISLILFCICQSSDAQQNLGLRGSNVQWRQIKTDTARVIFPEGQESEANRVTHILHKMAREYPISDLHLQKIKIILQESSTISNGYVGFGPLRSEFYLQPYQDPFALGSLPWLDLLTVHEYRHVQQLSATNVGLSNLLFGFFGQNAYSGAVHLSVPDWYLEGDAVMAETALTNQGRGRLASFTKMFYEKERLGETWNYQLLRNGSFQKRLPDQYPLGYIMAKHGRREYGQQFWNDVLQEGAKYKSLLYPFSSALKNKTGKNTTEFYKDALDAQQKIWNNQSAESTEYKSVKITNKNYSNPKKQIDFQFPTADEKGNIYALIDRFDKIEGIYKIKPNGEISHTVSLGSQVAPHFSLNKNLLAWTEYRTHPRWQREDRTAILIYDVEKKRKKELSTKGKYFMPSASPNGRQVVALHSDESGYHNLHIIDINSGDVKKIIANPNNYYYAYPSWVQDSDDGEADQKIMATARNNKGQMAVVFINPDNGEVDAITHWSFHIFGRPVLHKNWIYVTSNMDKIDQVFAINPDEGIPHQVTKGHKFHYAPTYDKRRDQLIFTEFTLQGHRLKRAVVEPRNWTVKNMSDGIKPFEIDGDEKNILSDVPTRALPIKKYAKLGQPINLHSINVTGDDPTYGVEVLSESVLGNVGLTAGYEYNRNTRSYGPYVNATFSYWYPELTVGFRNRNVKVRDQNDRSFTFRQNTVSAGIRLPFSFTSGLFNQFFSLSSNINTGFTTIKPAVESIPKRKISYLSHSLLFQNSKRRAYQHATPQFGQRILASYAHDIDSLTINQFTLTSDFSFPGFSPNHTFILQVDYVKEKNDNRILLGENFRFSRGFQPFENDEAVRLGINYHFPLLYPDFGIAGIAFIKRIRMKPFFDHTSFSLNGNNQTIQSIGSEWHFDLSIFNVESIEFGFRWAYQLNDPLPGFNRNIFEFFIPLERL